MGVLSSIVTEIVREIFHLIPKYGPIEESAPDRGKFWPQFVGALIATVIVMVNVIVKLDLWVDLLYYYIYWKVALFVVAIVILLTLPVVLGFLLYTLKTGRIWRFSIGFLTPFLIAFLVREIFYWDHKS